MNKIVTILLALGVVVFIFSKINAAGLEKAANQPATTESKPIHFSINPGENLKEIALDLKEKGAIADSSVFINYAKKTGTDTRIKPGEYTVDSSLSPKEILARFVAGDRKEAWITIPEGWRIDQIADYLDSEGLVTKEDFVSTALVKNFSGDFAFLSTLPGNTSLEGYLFPDTYKVFAETDSKDIITRMLTNFQDKVSKDIMRQANAQGLTLHQFLTLASIVEKESAHNDDVAKISSVYHNRLNQGMNFQSDATITYITRRPDPRPLEAETKIDSPYNTYLYPGLPPGPVGNPGLSAIDATLHPADTPYLFFVSRDNRAYFATTYDEHLVNIATYLDQ
ncbi:MAG: endolytic transglycosylase MltG [Patescibacteria group bacterium]